MYPSYWESYIKWEPSIKYWKLTCWCYHDGFDYVGITLAGLTLASDKRYYSSPRLGTIKESWLDNFLSWLVKNISFKKP